MLARRITEVTGLPGSGKTALCMRAALDALTADADALVLWLDPQGTFPLRRFAAMASGSVDSAMGRLLLCRTETYEELRDILLSLAAPNALSDVRLIVIDDVCVPLRTAVDPADAKALARRTVAIRTLGLVLRRALNPTHGSRLAVLVCNDLSTADFDEHGRQVLRPALGDSWSAVVDRRILLSASTPPVLIKSDYSGDPIAIDHV